MTSQLTFKWFSKATPLPPTKKENVCVERNHGKCDLTSSVRVHWCVLHVFCFVPFSVKANLKHMEQVGKSEWQMRCISYY